jgi:hypothetical protein
MIYLKKTGVFYENEYNTDAEEYVYKQVKSVIPYLNDGIEIDKNFTLEDFFDIVEDEEEIFQAVFSCFLGHFPLRPFIEEIQKDCLPEGEEDLECIECQWVAEQFDYRVFYEEHKDDERKGSAFELMGDLREPDKDSVNEITIYTDVHGWGKYQPCKDETYEEGETIPTHMGYAIEFTPLYRLKHLPIRLNTDFVIREKNKIGLDDGTVVEGKKEFSVFEVFGAILSEISFAGLPEDRDEKWQDITDTVDEIKKDIDDEKLEEN